ncbi:unnamed protein product [Paramecium sonneborni]|uniref:non-specific serine/threonine protein kinase n=1 Tax=Paramecium sonneborni TaxID=65129 RepID=A0A8S1NCT8_9CILI|nr:unnamed protein product [Paramecium sonneborni]
MEPEQLLDKLNDILLADHFRFIEVIGRGSFGVVVAAFCSNLDRIVAIKITSNIDQENEANLLKACCHQNIVKLYKVLVANNHLYLIMERLVGLTLDKLLKQSILSEQSIRNYMIQILNALVFLHKKNIIHRDLKPGKEINIIENIFICENACLKLIDLGLGQEIVCKGCVYQSVGTPYFIAPEVILGKEQSQAIDIFSLGIIFYMMINNLQHPLWDGQMRKRNYYEFISNEFTISFPKTMSEMAKDFVLNTVQFRSENRMTALQCLEHPWIKGKGVKTHPMTTREIMLRYNIQQKLQNIIKSMMFMKTLQQTCEEEIHYIKTNDSPLIVEKEEEQFSPHETDRARLSVELTNQKQKPFKLHPIQLKKVNSYKDLLTLREKQLNQQKYQNMILRFKEKLSLGNQLNVIGHQNFDAPISHRKLTTLPTIKTNRLQRQSTFNFKYF